MRKFLVISLFVITFMLSQLMLTNVATAEEMVKVPKSYLKAVKAKLEKLDAIEKANPEITVDKLSVVQNENGIIYVKNTGEAHLKLAMLKYTGEVDVTAEVKVFKPAIKEPFISRFGVVCAGEQRESKDYNKIDKGAVYLDGKIIYYNKYSIDGIINTKRYGVGVARSITPNTFGIVGVNWRFGEKLAGNAKLFAGAGFRF